MLEDWAATLSNRKEYPCVSSRRWRKMTWVFLIVNALFVFWIAAGVSDRPSMDCANDPDVKAGIISQDLCESASDVGTGLGVVMVGFFWFIVFVVLSLIWLMTRPKRRTCPACGEDVKKGLYDLSELRA